MIDPPTARHRPTTRDRGIALPLVLVITSTIALLVISLSTYAITNLRFGRVAENRSDRLSAADAGMRYAIDQLKLRNAGCILDTQEAVLPGVEADFNGATASVTCERITTGFEGIGAYAAVMTGEGVPSNLALLSSQSGSNDKILGGPVYMSRVDSSAFDLGPPVQIENGPLLYHDTTGDVPCRSVRSSTMPSQLVFEPELIFGPVCVSVSWEEIFDSPEVPDLGLLTERDGSVDFTDVSGAGGCRVFEPGRYTTPPDVRGVDAYFKTGDYVFDFDPSDPVFEVRQSVVTAGRVNPLTTSANEIPTTSRCEQEQGADVGAGADDYGATFYFAGPSRINIATQGSLEIHTRQQGTADYVSVQTLCAPNGGWCNPTGDGNLAVPSPSSLTAPAASANDNFLFTDSGNNKEFVAHGLVYAPLAQIEFGNVSNTATQRMLGGLITSRLVLQSSTSATNFEISVPTSPITAKIQLTSVAEKDGTTAIRSVVEYRPYEDDIAERVRVNSWRVCETADCTPVEVTAPPTTAPPTTAPPSTTTPATCPGASNTWNGQYFANTSLSGTAVFTDSATTLAYDWGSGSPDGSVPDDGFSARWTGTFDLPEAGTYRFTVGTDDGQRFSVNGSLVLDDWNVQPIGSGTNTVEVEITDPCGVDLELEYFENSGVAEAFVSWTRVP